ncbi:MAG: hypothetical protein FJW95_07145 [Actinobacteria bacterium]|nr:hypothetical protein [Actinomycetota bacterium]
MRRRAARLTAVMVAALGVGAVGASVPVGAGDLPRPCDLLTRRQLTKAFGQPAGKPDDSLGPAFCQWTLAATPTRAPGQVNVVLETGARAKGGYATGERLAGTQAEPIADLGKKAFFAADTGTLFVLAAGPTLFYVQGNVYDAAANRATDGLKDTLTALAAKAEARL